MHSYSTKENTCKNFSPNLFNKTKCQNCFKPRETHVLLDKDLSKAKPIYCGWLLLAPIGTDFDNPVHKSRKWQRRWFVLFEHGLLHFALDDNANTIPQGNINMNNCIDVIKADRMTGQKNSLSIILPDMKYFIRGECKEDTLGWFEALIVYPETAKENARIKKKLRKEYKSISSHSTVEPKTPKPAAASTSLGRAKSLDRGTYSSKTIPANMLNLKKGWLSKREVNEKEVWIKHWFVLSDQKLKFFKDSIAEDYAEADGEINLRNCENVTEVDVERNYGFKIHNTDGEYMLSAMTNGIRRNWMNAILKAANIKANTQKTATVVTNKEKEVAALATVNQDKTEDIEKSVDMSLSERSQRRRARIRERRINGRSRTYDFAEFRETRSKAVEDDKEPSKSVLQSLGMENSPIRVRQNSGSAKRSYRTPVLQQTPFENQWQKIENYHLVMDDLEVDDPISKQGLSTSSKTNSLVKSLQDEIDSLKQQMEKNRLEKAQMCDDIHPRIPGTYSDDFKEKEREYVVYNGVENCVDPEVELNEKKISSPPSHESDGKELKRLENDENIALQRFLKQLHAKVVELQKEKSEYTLTFWESILVDVIQLLGKAPPGFLSKFSDTKAEFLSSNLDEMRLALSRNQNDLDIATSAKLEMLAELLEENRRATSSFPQPQQHSRLETSKTRDGINIISDVPDSPSLSSSSDGRVSTEDKMKLFAEQLSTQAMIITEMAASLEKHQVGSKDSQKFCGESLKKLASHDLKSDSSSSLLKHSDTLAENLLLKGCFMSELAKLRDAYSARVGSSSSQDFTKFERMGVEATPGLEDLEQTASLLVTRSHISYVMQVYNDRIARLSHDAKVACFRADSYQRKLRDLVHACKTQDVEQVSKLAVEVDTGMSPDAVVKELPPWKQQVDYGTLHGAEGSFASMNLALEASFFSDLAKDVACMSSDVHNLVELGVRIIGLSGSLFKFLRPSEIGERATTIAYEAITQAEIIFLCQRIQNDYKQELVKMKLAMKEQSSHCETLQSKLMEMKDGGSERMQELTDEHKKKVERLRQQLALVEKARVEMSLDMDANLTRLSQKHQKEMELCTDKHHQETDVMRHELANVKQQLQDTVENYMKEIKKFKERHANIENEHRKQIETTTQKYESRIGELEAGCDERIEAAMNEHRKSEQWLKNESEKDIRVLKKNHDKEIHLLEKRGKREIENLKNLHEQQLDKLNEEQNFAVDHLAHEWQENLKTEMRKLQEGIKNHSEPHLDFQFKETSETFHKMHDRIKSIEQEYEEILFNREQLHDKNLEHMKETMMLNARKQVEDKGVQSDETPPPLPSPGKAILEKRTVGIQIEMDSTAEKLYQEHLNEIKKHCDESFADNEEILTEHLNERDRLHLLKIEKLQEERDREMEENVTAMKTAIESISKHHKRELEELQGKMPGIRDQKEDCEYEKLKIKFDTLSEHYADKCLEASEMERKLKEAEERLYSVDHTNKLLEDQNEELGKKLETELTEFRNGLHVDTEKAKQEIDGEIYHLQVQLRVKESVIAFLKQKIEVLKQQLKTSIQGKKYSQQEERSR